MTASDPLTVLLDRACRGVATPAEAEQLRAAVSALQQQLAAFHEGEEPYEDEATVPTPAQWVWRWNRATPQRRLETATHVLEQQDRLNHYTWTERIQLHERAEAAERRAGSADRYRVAWQSARRRAHWARCVLADYRTAADARQAVAEPLAHRSDISQDDDGEWNVSCPDCPAYVDNIGDEDDAEEWAKRHQVDATAEDVATRAKNEGSQ